MAWNLDAFSKQKEYLICVDSDGCAMDTMDIKHFRCFGPCMVEEWSLEEWKKPILDRWNEINLYTMTRGINRFKGLAMALAEIDKEYTAIAGVEELVDWAERAPELSNSALSKAAESAQGPALAKALSWSKKVNAAIDALPESEKKPFAGVAEGLAAAHGLADVAVVSSANREAVVEEWQKWNLLDHVDVLCCQDSGSKALCISELKKKGYAPDHILMVGDAPGDKDAADKNGVYYYPILVRHEAESWASFGEALDHLRKGSYVGYGQQKAKEFLDNLSGNV